MIDLATLAPWAATGLGGGVGFLAVKWLVEWLSGRTDKRREGLDTSMMTLLNALQKQVADQDKRIARIEKENAELRERIDRQRGREIGLEDENKDLREQVKALEARLDALEALFSKLPVSPEIQAEIDRLDQTAPRRRRRK